jgi:peptidoglycan/LPS O-acetylase OafA/YrhL
VAPPLRPDPPPLEVDDPRIIGVGLALWAVALVVLVALDLSGTSIPGWWHVMCVAGTALGVLGVRVISRRAARES